MLQQENVMTQAVGNLTSQSPLIANGLGLQNLNNSSLGNTLYQQSVIIESQAASLLLESQGLEVQTTSNTVLPLFDSKQMNTSRTSNTQPTTTITSPYDLLILNPQAPTSVTRGSTFTITYDLKNQGTSTVINATNRFYLSQDSLLDGSDILFSAIDSPFSIMPNIPYPRTVNLTTSMTLAPGNYYLIYKADAANSIAESNENNNTAIRQITITSTTSTNNPPVANNNTFTTNEDTILNGNVLTNDTDPENNTLTASLVSNVSNGVLTLNSNGTFNYTPNANYFGTDSFTYRANDGSLNSNIATVSITINPVNDAPIANNDTFTTNKNTIFNGNVLTNDTDAENNSLTSLLVSNVSNGVLTLNSNGTFSYTPNNNYVGTDSFTYRASDGSLNSNVATVNLTVNAVNTAPIANNDTFATNKNTILNGNVLTNDTDSENNALTASLVSNVSNGVLTLNSNGTFSYTPNNNYVGTDSFTYRANDGSLNSNVATVNLTVNAVNTAPIANNDTFVINEDTILNGNVLTNDTDSENNTLTTSLVSNVSNGVLTLNSNGTFNYTPNNNYVGTDSFTYRANDGSLNSNVATVSITINGINDAPIANNDTFNLVNNGTITINKSDLLVNDADIDSTNLSINAVSNAVNGTVALVNGNVQFTPNANFAGLATFQYTITDGNLISNLATVNLNLTTPPTNNSPDLTITNLTSDSNVILGNYITINYSVQNVGNSQSPENNIYFYFSNDSQLDNSDVLINYQNVTSLNANDSVSRTVVLTTRSVEFSSGVKYLIAKIDGDNLITETNENNNTSSGIITINKTDLSLTNFTAPNEISVGNSFTVDYTVQNISSFNATLTYTDFYLSTDNILDQNDTLLLSDAAPSLTVGNTWQKTTNLTVNNIANLANGNYYLIAKADGLNWISESNEVNNIITKQISLKVPDLSISSFTVNNQVIIGENLGINYTVNNIGNGNAKPTDTKFYLSLDNNLDTVNDIYLGQNSVLALNTNSSANQSVTLFIPNSISQGNYTLFAKADGDNELSESNENNNIISRTISINSRDLSITSLNSPNSVNIGSNVNFSYAIANLGNVNAPNSVTKFYLSTNNVYDINTDILIGSDNPNTINANSNLTRNISLSFSNNLASGNYYLLAIADSNNEIYEGNETNNLLSKAITINSQTNDLSVFDFNIPNNKLGLNNSTNINYQITNTGGLVNTNVKFYLSTNNTFDTNDQLLGTSVLNNLVSGTSTQSVTLNVGTQTGYYYLLAVADSDNQVTESNELNNVTYKTVNIINDDYSQYYGYGMINAAIAVARAINQVPFADVTNLGGNSFNLDMINVPEVWAQGYTGQGITVAVIDTGCYINHPDLINNIWVNQDEIANNGIDDDNNGFIDDINGWDFVQNDNGIAPEGHGTHVSGTIASSNDGIGSTGIAYNAKIMPLQVFSDQGSGSWYAIEKAIYYAVDNGARVINMSLGGGPYENVKTAIAYAESKGVVVVSAAGNSGEATPIYPAAFATEVGIAVGSVNTSGGLSNFSNRSGNDSNMLYVTAPGEAIYSTGTGWQGYDSKQGTSMATPHVAGVAALMLSANPNLTVNEVKEILKETSGGTSSQTTSLSSLNIRNAPNYYSTEYNYLFQLS